MTALQVQLPNQLHRKIFEVAEAQHTSMDMIVAASLAQWLSRIRIWKNALNAPLEKRLPRFWRMCRTCLPNRMTNYRSQTRSTCLTPLCDKGGADWFAAGLRRPRNQAEAE